MMHSNHNALDHSIFDHDDHFSDSQSHGLNRSQPSGGGGGLAGSTGGGAGSQSGSGNGSSGSGGANSSADEEAEEAQAAEPQEEPEEELTEEETGPFVSLTDAKFVTPEEVVIDTETAVQVSVEYLKTRKPSQIQFEITATYNGEEEKAPSVSGTVKDGVATAQVLLPMHQGFYSTEGKTDADKIEYTFTAKCDEDETECDGDLVQLPTKQNDLKLIEIDSAVFNHDNIVPCLDENATLIDSIATAFRHTAHDEPDHELVIYGHATGSLAFTASEQRAVGIKAIIKDDTSAWKNLCVGYGASKDYQQSLKTLSDSYGWDCDPGAVDGAPGAKTIAGVLGFQRTYNATYNKRIKVDGDWGGNSWIALMKTIRHLAVYLSQVEETRINTEFYSKVDGVLPCADTFPKASTGAEGYTSSSEDRVELLYHARPNPPTMAKTSEGQVSTQEAGAYEQALCDIETVAYDGLDFKDLDRLENVAFWCEHSSEEKSNDSNAKYAHKRLAKDGLLEVVPDASKKDKITLKGQTKIKKSNIRVNAIGEDTSYFPTQQLGPSVSEISFDAPSYDRSWSNILPIHVDPSVGIEPKVINVEGMDARDNSQSGIIKVYPSNVEATEIDVQKIFGPFTKLQKGFEQYAKGKLGLGGEKGKKFSFDLLAGKIVIKGNFAEDPYSNKVFYAYAVEGGFDPIVGAKFTDKFSLYDAHPVARLVPEKVRKYIADVGFTYSVEGKISFSIEIAKTSPELVKGDGSLKGAIGFTAGIYLEIWNGKVLKVTCTAGTQIEGVAQISYQEQQRNCYDLGANLEINIGGLKGCVAADFFDGKFVYKKETVFFSPYKVGPKYIPFTSK